MTDQSVFSAPGIAAPLDELLGAELRDQIRDYLGRYAANPVFRDAEDHETLILDNPFRRPLRSRDIQVQDFARSLSKSELCSNHALSANRALLNIYESDLVFLPNDGAQQSWEDFSRFYSEESRVLGEILRPVLERHLFGFLEQEISISGTWTLSALRDYLLQFDTESQVAGNRVVDAIARCPEPRKGAQLLLIQFAGDFLTEASPMARNVLGAYGQAQSEMFKILSDEYGYGVHKTKHSTLFEETLKSCGLQPGVHSYWQYYLPTSLLLNNFYHHLSRNHRSYFRYLGALYYAEVGFRYATRAQSRLLKSVFGRDVDTAYFDEHTHIDQHHSRMALERLVLPMAEAYGARAIGEIVRGFEEARVVQEVADEDFLTQLAWLSRLEAYRTRGAEIFHRIQTGELHCDLETFLEMRGERSTTHVHDDHRLLVIDSGAMDFWPGHPDAIRFEVGDVLYIPMHRLHGSVVRTEACNYHQPMVPANVIAQYPPLAL